jgi:uncharacterized protein (TIGR02466 family)
MNINSQRKMKDNTQVHSIFSTPIYISKLDKPFIKKEYDYILKQQPNVYYNEGNTASKENFILHNKQLKNLRKEIDIRIKDYFDNVLHTNDKVTPYMTQSWVNFTGNNQYHHKHVHHNSLVSGVCYIQCEEEDKVFFQKDVHKPVKLDYKSYNVWNSTTWNFKVNQGDILLFPSDIFHMVENKERSNIRISLAFNVFVKGVLGDQTNLDQLSI